MSYRHIPLVLAFCLGLAPTSGVADIVLSPGTTIVFGDGSELDSAPETASVPAGHGGTNTLLFGTDPYVGGGNSNTAGANYATISGGRDNTANGVYGTVAGGFDNTASGYGAFVAGGVGNSASGDYSFAAGKGAQGNADGTFSFTDDSDDVDFPNNQPNSFFARATGGFILATATTGTAINSGAVLTAGDSSWNVFSDRAGKENFVELEPQAVAERVASLPVSEWNYKHQHASRRHIGPMAQDFNAAFGTNVGLEHMISSQDISGVSLAAIKGLYQMIEDRDETIATMEQALADAVDRIDRLERPSRR